MFVSIKIIKSCFKANIHSGFFFNGSVQFDSVNRGYSPLDACFIPCLIQLFFRKEFYRISNIY